MRRGRQVGSSGRPDVYWRSSADHPASSDHIGASASQLDGATCHVAAATNPGALRRRLPRALPRAARLRSVSASLGRRRRFFPEGHCSRWIGNGTRHRRPAQVHAVRGVCSAVLPRRDWSTEQCGPRPHVRRR